MREWHRPELLAVYDPITAVVASIGAMSASSMAGAAGLGAGLLGAVGSVAQGYATQQAQEYNAKVLQIQAKTSEDQAAAASANLVDKTRRQVATGIASGLEGGSNFSGSFRDIVTNADAFGHLDALNAIYKGTVAGTGYRNQAAADIYAGNAAWTGGLIGAGTNLLKGVGVAYKSGSLDT